MLRLGLNKKARAHRTAQPPALAVFLPWGIQQELVVRDLPGANVQFFWVFKQFTLDNFTLLN